MVLPVTLVGLIVFPMKPLPSLAWSFKITEIPQRNVEGHPASPSPYPLCPVFLILSQRTYLFLLLLTSHRFTLPLLLMQGVPIDVCRREAGSTNVFENKAVLGKHASAISADSLVKCCFTFSECPQLGRASFWKISTYGTIFQTLYNTLRLQTQIAWMCPNLCEHFLCDSSCQYTLVSVYGM